ncbi:MAG TPA: hypothetical protein VFW33_02395 [Gemmataceae bacterium]|nr:hypothetical protein [Gemmataceae bacterium]
MSDSLKTLAARAENDPFFMASPLAAYARGERLDDAALAAALGCAPGDLAMLRLCRAPRSDPAEFWDDVSRVAERFGIDPQRLAEAVRQGRVLLRFQAPRPGANGLLMAARDREPDPPAEAP